MPSTSASVARMAATVFGHWRANSAALSAPRQSAGAPPTPKRHALFPNVLKKFRRFMLATRRLPARAGAAAGRGLPSEKSTAPPSAPTGLTRYALPLALAPAQVNVITPTVPVTRSPPRSVFDADSG